MNEKEFKEYLEEEYSRDHPIRENWEILVVEYFRLTEEEADAEYGMWFDEYTESIGEGTYG